MKKLFIRTFGCQMNEYDSERIIALLEEEYQLCFQLEEADLIVVNTCSVREKAEQKVYSLVGRLKHLKRKRPHLIIAVVGCVAQQEGERILQRLPHVDLVLGPQAIYRIKEYLSKCLKGEGPIVDVSLERSFHLPLLFCRSHIKEKPVKAFVTIMQGCDNFCSYCVVPYTRGREISRPPEEILKEIEFLVSHGVREVTLLGQNVNSYGKKEKGFPSFAQLLKEVASISGLWRIRFTTSHPKDLTEELMECFESIPQLCEHLHLPVQSGSNRILKLMHRRYSREEYLSKISLLRGICPEIFLTTDIIVGFPGEKEEDFQATLDLLQEVRYAEIFSFKYSDRPFARAKDFSDKVSENIKKQRLFKVHEVQSRITQAINANFVGKEVEILVEGKSRRRNKALWSGRTRSNHIVNFEGPGDLKGSLVYVLIEEAGKHSLKGRFLEKLNI